MRLSIHSGYIQALQKHDTHAPTPFLCTTAYGSTNSLVCFSLRTNHRRIARTYWGLCSMNVQCFQVKIYTAIEPENMCADNVEIF